VEKDNIKILDCTLRDGGFCLEDAAKYDINTKLFSDNDMKFVIDKLIAAKIDYIEIGAVEQSDNDKSIYGIKNGIEDFTDLITKSDQNKIGQAVFFRGPDIPIKNVPNWKKGICPIIRLCVRYSEIVKSIEYCKKLKQKGYQISIQPMVTVRYTNEQLKYIFEAANEMDAFAVYFVDSYGYLTKENILEYFAFFDENLSENISIGFHGHNNMCSTFSNAQTLIDLETNRKIIIDSCVMGMGQGAGNLQTELLASYLNIFDERYNFGEILDICDYIETIKGFNLWGYSVDRLLPAIHKVAYKYSFALHHQYGVKFREINRMLKLIPEEMRHRYTPENVKKLMEISGYKY
jgi:4-hydroxy 2-oxovalerate aldolase